MEKPTENDDFIDEVKTEDVKTTKSAKKRKSYAPKRDGVLALISTRALCRDAIDVLKTELNHHDLPPENPNLEPLFCIEKVDSKGQRHEIERGDRAGRPMINVRDGPEESNRKNEERIATANAEGKKMRESKNAKSDGTLVTYTKHLATHVVLFASDRAVPSNGLHASHLCHNERCLRSTHIRVESGALNQRRKGCAGVLVCRNCWKIWHICNHHEVFKCLSVTIFVCCGGSSQQVAKVNVPHPVDEIATVGF